MTYRRRFQIFVPSGRSTSAAAVRDAIDFETLRNSLFEWREETIEGGQGFDLRFRQGEGRRGDFSESLRTTLTAAVGARIYEHDCYHGLAPLPCVVDRGWP